MIVAGVVVLFAVALELNVCNVTHDPAAPLLSAMRQDPVLNQMLMRLNFLWPTKAHQINQQR